MGETEVDRFWHETEARLGERILLYSLGQYLNGYADVRSGCWGLFFISESALHFQTFPSQNWFSSLFRGFARSRATRDADYEMEFMLPQASMNDVRLINQQSRLMRFLSPHPPVVAVNYIDEDGREGELRFSMDMKVKDFVNLLRARLP